MSEIKDFVGNEVFSESETIFVAESKSFAKELDTSSLPVGDYLIALEII